MSNYQESNHHTLTSPSSPVTMGSFSRTSSMATISATSSPASFNEDVSSPSASDAADSISPERTSFPDSDQEVIIDSIHSETSNSTLSNNHSHRFSILESILETLEAAEPSPLSVLTAHSTSANASTATQEDNAVPRITKHIFFDCDNTLVDTEAIATEACAKVSNKFLAEHGIMRIFTVEELVSLYYGRTARQMIEMLAKVYEVTLDAEKKKEYAIYEENLVIELIWNNPRPCTGIERVLEDLSARGEYNVAVVSSSPIRRIRAALEATGLDRFFATDQIFSAKNSMPTSISKPDPAIYNFAMQVNNAKPWECIAIEDSRSGARSAILAAIPCIAYVGCNPTPAEQEQVAHHLTKEGCRAIMQNYTQFFGIFENVQSAVQGEWQVRQLKDLISLEEKWQDYESRAKKMLRDHPTLANRLREFMAQPGWEHQLHNLVKNK